MCIATCTHSCYGDTTSPSWNVHVHHILGSRDQSCCYKHIAILIPDLSRSLSLQFQLKSTIDYRRYHCDQHIYHCNPDSQLLQYIYMYDYVFRNIFYTTHVYTCTLLQCSNRTFRAPITATLHSEYRLIHLASTIKVPPLTYVYTTE